MIFKHENKILNILRYSPPLFIISISIILIIFFYLENKKTFENEKKLIQIKHINDSKQLIKDQVHSVHLFIQRERDYLEIDLKESLDESLKNAHRIAMSIYENNMDKPQIEIKKLILDALREIRFNDGRGYFFIYDMNGKNIMHPILSEIENKDMINHKDLKGSFVIRDMIELLKKDDEAFHEWYWKRPNDTEDIDRKKIGLVKRFTPFNWFIGTGEYVEDFEKKLQDSVLRHIREIRFSKNGYIFVIDYDSVYLSHIRKNFIGKKATANQDTVDIEKVIADIIEISKKGDGFYSYIQNKKPDNNLPTKKTSYVKGLNEWEWIIGSGFYEDDIEKELEEKKEELDRILSKKISNTITISIILTFILLIISMFISRGISKIFQNYKRDIEEQMQQNLKNQKMIAHKSKMVAIGEMINNIAHQWRQPLSIITTCATGMIAQKELDILDDGKLVEGLENINKSSQYLSQTIDNLRYFSKENQQKKFFKVNESVDKVLEILDQTIKENRVIIFRDYDQVEIEQLENEFIQIMLNILNNSIDELSKSQKHEKFIKISIRKRQEKVEVRIIDNAGGIDPKIIERVVEPYFTTKEKSQGTGLGLYLTKLIITKQLEGTIELSNTVFTHNDSTYDGLEVVIVF